MRRYLITGFAMSSLALRIRALFSYARMVCMDNLRRSEAAAKAARLMFAVIITGRETWIPAEGGMHADEVPIFITDAGKVKAAYGWQPNCSMKIVDGTNLWVRHQEDMLRPVFVRGSR